MTDPGRLVGVGRAADVYEAGPGRVLRRYKIPPPPGWVEREAAVMGHVRRHGYPVPTVVDVDGDDLVMERLHGTTVLDDLGRRPWRVDRHARLWAEMVARLADVPVEGLADAGLVTRFGPPDAVLHLDLHPGNIMLTPDGPVVFDWTNATLGPVGADAAMAWILGASSTVDGPWWMRGAARLVQRRMVAGFLAASDRDAIAALLPSVAAHRLTDRNVRPEEAARIRSLVDQAAPARAK